MKMRKTHSSSSTRKTYNAFSVYSQCIQDNFIRLPHTQRSKRCTAKYCVCITMCRACVCVCVFACVRMWLCVMCIVLLLLLNRTQSKAIGMMKKKNRLSLSFWSLFDRSVRSSPVATRLPQRNSYAYTARKALRVEYILHLYRRKTEKKQPERARVSRQRKNQQREFLFWWLFWMCKRCMVARYRRIAHIHTQSTGCASVVHAYKCT